MTIKQLVKKSHKTAKEKGFWEHKRNLGELLMLITSELGEALEADRKGRKALSPKYLSMIEGLAGKKFKVAYEANLKDCFETEIADVLIRIGDLCGGMGVGIERYIKLKMRYNELRERLHGKQY